MTHSDPHNAITSMRIDLAGAMSLKTTTYDGNTVPREARLDLQLAADF